MPKKKERTAVGPQTLAEAILHFADPDRALEYVVAMRWPDGEVSCPHCGSTAVLFLKNQRRWKCSNDHPRRQFSAKVGTIFEDSPLGWDVWLPAFWMVISCKNGVSSYEIHRALNITQKSAWFVLHRIRLALQNGSIEKIGGEVEVDETFIGGLARFMHKDKKAKKIKGTGPVGKVAVMGLLQRHGGTGHSKVRVKVIASRKRNELQANVRAYVLPGAAVMTDELASYTGLEKDYIHNVINHAEEYVRGSIHTNGMENFWSLLKRTLKGTYVSVEPFHLHRYIDEQAYRFNERGGTDAERFQEGLKQVVGRRITYKELIGEKPEPSGPAPLPN